jgi:predicted nuclease of predicted toxin-antitoxin system
MKFLIDENLSNKLVKHLAPVFPGTTHVKTLLLTSQPDSEIWEVAKREGYIILTQDDDFVELSVLRGMPPKVVVLTMGNHSTSEWSAIIMRNAAAIESFGRDGSIGLLILR